MIQSMGSRARMPGFTITLAVEVWAIYFTSVPWGGKLDLPHGYCED